MNFHKSYNQILSQQMIKTSSHKQFNSLSHRQVLTSWNLRDKHQPECLPAVLLKSSKSFFFLAQCSHEKHLSAHWCAHTMPTLPAQVVTNPPQGWKLEHSGKAPRGRAERSLVPVYMVSCAGSGTISVWLRRRVELQLAIIFVVD